MEYLWMVSFQCVNIIVQNGNFCSISPFVLKYLPHPVLIGNRNNSVLCGTADFRRSLLVPSIDRK